MSNFDGFYDAKVAREIAVGDKASTGGVVLREINALQIAIDTAVATNVLDIEIGTGLTGGTTDMTTNVSVDYYTAWAESAASDPNSSLYDPDARVARERMAKVINYFTRLGYTINRERNALLDEFKWVIRW